MDTLILILLMILFPALAILGVMLFLFVNIGFIGGFVYVIGGFVYVIEWIGNMFKRFKRNKPLKHHSTNDINEEMEKAL